MAEDRLRLLVPPNGLLRVPCFAGLWVTVSIAKEKRSIAQNATLWGPVYDQILTQLMKQSGYRQDEAEAPLEPTNQRREASRQKQLVHYGLLAERFGYATDPLTRLQVPARTSSELNTSEMADYFKWLQVYLAEEHSIQVELPDELPAEVDR